MIIYTTIPICPIDVGAIHQVQHDLLPIFPKPKVIKEPIRFPKNRVTGFLQMPSFDLLEIAVKEFASNTRDNFLKNFTGEVLDPFRFLEFYDQA